MKGAAVVTGGAGGIGRAVIARLAGAGFTTVSWDLRGDAPAHHALTVDVTDGAALQQAAQRNVELAGPLRALVVNAGILGPVARAWEVPPEQVRHVIDTNLVSAFLTVRAVVPLTLSNPAPDRGRIVMMASLQAKEGTVEAGPYAAAKAGLVALTKVMGKELAGDGILINAVTPTVVLTPMEKGLTPKRRAFLLAKIPMARFAEADEVAAMVAWLCGPDCTFSTGAVFDISGGRATS